MKRSSNSRKLPFGSPKMRAYRRQEFILLSIIVFLSFATALAVFFLDATKDLRYRAADDVGLVCNRSCTENRDCLSNMVCWPYGRPSDQKGACRLDSNPNNESCNGRQGIGFIVQVYNDLNADGMRNNNEQGVSWDFRWDLNGDENWRPYAAYAEKNGEGGRVADLNANDVVRIRIQGKGGWDVVTPTEMQLVMANETTRVAFFGVKVHTIATPKPTSNTTNTGVTKGGLGGTPEPELKIASPSPSPTPSIVPSPSPVVIQPQQPVGFLGWLRQFFRRLYCSWTKNCVEL